ncbi:hypothetical protein MYX76_16430 [Desulfobacterota bacterium AH_259_B03_O07]|nr:hypothetical protein [Desulfobacterota bacterium AH_259_B03_O07]
MPFPSILLSYFYEVFNGEQYIAVSDLSQLDRIKKHASSVGELGKKLKYWDYDEVLENHEALSAVNESINRLGLVPQGF